MFGVCFNPFNMYSFTLTAFDEIDKLKKNSLYQEVENNEYYI